MSTTTTPLPTTGTKPTSIKIEPWTDFPRQSYTIHGDDFCHEKPLVLKLNARGARSVLNIKETVSSKEGKFSVEDDVKLWFDLPNHHAIYTRIKSSNYLKVIYDHGLFENNGRLWNFYSSFWTDKSLSKSSIRLGAGIIHARYQTDNRLRINTSSGAHTFYLYNRSLAFWNQTKFGVVSVINLTNKIVQKNNILLGHVFNNKHETFLRLQNEGFRSHNPNLNDVKTIWDTITANYVGRIDQTTRLGLETSFNIRDFSPKKIEAVIEKVLPERGVVVKAKVNHNYDVAFLFKRALYGLEDLVTFSAGCGVRNVISDKRSLHTGIQLDFNI